MQAPTDNPDDTVLIAPERINADTRNRFRSDALDHIERVGADREALVIDMSRTVELDASGLGILILIQKRAKERGMSTRLRHTPERVHNLLKLTKLDFLFELT